MSKKLFAGGGVGGGKGWRKMGEDVRMGEERHGCWGIDTPKYRTK